jgi:hypothetical protein
MTGSVGINVASPANLLHLAGASATPSLRLGSISTGFHWDIGRENATTGDFVFNNANGGSTSERLRITVGGNVGVGTMSPSTRLTVYAGSGAISGTNDAIRLQVSSYADAARNTIIWGQDSSNLVLARFGLEWNLSTSQMNFVWRDMYNSTTGSAELMRLTGGGDLGIGTNSPSRDPSGTRSLAVSGGGSLAASLDLYGNSRNFAIFTGGAGALGFFDLTAGSERMRITSDGKIGIGITNPVATKLSLGTGVGAKFLVYDNGSNVFAGLGQDLAAGNSTDLFAHSVSNLGFLTFGKLGTNGSTYTEWARFTPSGDFYIGGTGMDNGQTFGIIGSGVWDGPNIGLQNTGTGGINYTIFSTNSSFGQGAGNLLFYNVPDGRNNLILYANGNYDFAGSDVSDIRLKQDIENLNYGLNEIMALSPKSYHLKSEDNLQGEHQTTLRKRYGFIAQEVQSILPDTITGKETETD